MSNRLDQEREAKLAPLRMQGCKQKLEELGFQVQSFGGDRLEFQFKGHTIKFWPYSGWHSGKTIKDGRGFKTLLTQLGVPKPEVKPSCTICRRPINKKYAVPVVNGFAHQMCFRNRS